MQLIINIFFSAHPNIKLFISHGGLLGINEAVHAGVPVLGIPVFADQSTNVNMLKMIGAGDILHYKDISKDVVLQKVTNILNISRFDFYSLNYVNSVMKC